MEIVERREYEGSWWGRTSDGSWFRWSMAEIGWDGPLVPPWPAASAPHPDEAAIVARAKAAGAETARAFGDGPIAPTPGGRPIALNRLDVWWNRRFPPFSRRRLVFGLVALPAIAALQELLFRAIGREPSLPRYLFVCVAGGALLATAWLPGMREMAQRLQRPDVRRPPWQWPGAPTDAEPARPPVDRHRGRDFLIALPFSAILMLVISMTVSGPADAFTPTALLTNVVAALFTAAIVTLRTSLWGLALFSLAGGLLGGLFMVMLSVMTFSDPGGDFLLGWAFGIVLLFVYTYPMWQRLRSFEARGLRLPMWLVMGGSVLLVSGAALVFIAEH